MQTTLTRCVRKSSQRAGSRAGGAPDTGGFLKQFALRGRDPAVADENLYRYCGNEPTEATDPSGLADAPPNAHFDVTNRLSDVRSFVVGSITIQVGADATTTGRFTADSFKYQQLYAETGRGNCEGRVGRFGCPCNGRGQREAWTGWCRCAGLGIRHQAPQLHFVGAAKHRTKRSGLGLAKRRDDTWYGDDAQLIETSRQDFVDIAGIASADATQKEMQNGAVLVKKTSYAVAVLCWKDDKLNGKPLDSFLLLDGHHDQEGFGECRCRFWSGLLCRGSHHRRLVCALRMIRPAILSRRHQR